LSEIKAALGCDVESGQLHVLISAATRITLLLDSPDELVCRLLVHRRPTADGTASGDRSASKLKTNIPPKPDIRLRAKIEGLEDLGYFCYHTSGWPLVRDLPEIHCRLAKAAAENPGYPLRVTLELGTTTFKITIGPQAGETATYIRPFITPTR
jgi:hypothetical protein